MRTKEEILELCRKRNLNDIESLRLNHLVLDESEPILKEKGQLYIVKPGKKDRRTHKIGWCYTNSSNMMSKSGYGYVEGYVINKKDGFKFGHSWNVDDMGIHWDFTFDNTDDYDYFGVIVPDTLVWDVGRKNGGMWFCVLPFIEDFSY